MKSDDQDRVLLVVAEASLGDPVKRELGDLGVSVHSAGSAQEALAWLAMATPTLVISDLCLPDADGLTLLDQVLALNLPAAPAFAFLGAEACVDHAVCALQRGAVDFFSYPLKLKSFRSRVRRLLQVERMRRQVVAPVTGSAAASFHGIIGQSPQLQRLVLNVRRVAKAQGAVLITGASGVGKELVARAIHAESERRDAPFIAVNCASVPEHLLESEFFGHESGSFTGARDARPGLFAAAQGGTLLLDEVSELPVGLQAKLLRALQGGVRPVGAADETYLDVRVLAATNASVDDELASGRFRADLFYRLASFIVEVPTLAERRADVQLLAAHFLRKHRGRTAVRVGNAVRVEGLSCNVIEHLSHYPFPGNVRELENIIEHAVTFCRGPLVEMHDLPPRVRTRSGGNPSCKPAAGLTASQSNGATFTLDEMAERYVRHVLDTTQDNKRRAAQVLGISRQTLYRYLRADQH